ncbi:hypothetical protein MHYP_G00031840 [Metynnis hypsauchen]
MARKRTRVHFAVILLLCMVTLALAAPAESQCVGKLDRGQFRFDLPSRITTVMSDLTCDAFWSINDVVVASTKGFIPPVTSATTGTVFINTCPAALTFQLSCPDSDFHEKLQCSCPDTTTEAKSQSGKEGRSQAHSGLRVAGCSHHHVAAHFLREILNHKEDKEMSSDGHRTPEIDLGRLRPMQAYPLLC